MVFPSIADGVRLERLNPPKEKVRMVLDTDTYNEIDDQFAVTYALLSPEKLDVEALYAAPFHNPRSSGPADGMEKSYQEILRLLDRLSIAPDGLVHKGSTAFLENDEEPQTSDAADDLIRRAHRSGDGPLYVVSIGAITNIASAILKDPGIIEKIVVVWLGGQPSRWPIASEFNLSQDIHAARVMLNSGVPLVLTPCLGVASHLLTTLVELEKHIKGKGAIGDYLFETFRAYHDDHYAYAKEIWDLAPVAWLLNAHWVPSRVVTSPVLTEEQTWEIDPSRHSIREALIVFRNLVFADLFSKIDANAQAEASTPAV
jgi:inosine-uridine nucleoside N-ribohydrolase